MPRRIYLDDNATSPLRASSRAAMVTAMDVPGNPSSVHAEGRRARALVEDAREAVARLVDAKPSEVIFTSGAAEANATVIAGPWDRLLVAPIEHETVLRAAAGRERLAVTELAVHGSGLIDMDALAAILAGPGAASRTLLCLQLANNETGVIQPVAEAAELARAHGISVHCDAVQGVGRIPVRFAALGVDFMSLSAHKLGGPKGVGALVVRDGAALPALLAGGQERRRRGGTENVVGIAGFGMAASEALAELTDVSARLGQMRDQMESGIRACVQGAHIIGETAARLPNTTCLALPGQRAETLVIRLDLMGFAVSAGAACSSGKVGASHVLAAMGLPADLARAAIRVSLGRDTTAADVDSFVGAISEIMDRGGRVGRCGSEARLSQLHSIRCQTRNV